MTTTTQSMPERRHAGQWGYDASQFSPQNGQTRSPAKISATSNMRPGVPEIPVYLEKKSAERGPLNKNLPPVLAPPNQELDFEALIKLLMCLRSAQLQTEADFNKRNLCTVQQINAICMEQLEAYTQFFNKRMEELEAVRAQEAAASEIKKAVFLGVSVAVFCAVVLFSVGGPAGAAFAFCGLMGAVLSYKNVHLSKQIHSAVKTLFVKTGLDEALASAGIVSKPELAKLMNTMVGFVGVALVVPMLLDEGFAMQLWVGVLESSGVNRRAIKKIAPVLAGITLFIGYCVTFMYCTGVEKSGQLATSILDKVINGAKYVKTTLSGGVGGVKIVLSDAAAKWAGLKFSKLFLEGGKSLMLAAEKTGFVLCLQVGAQVVKSGTKVLMFYFRYQTVAKDADTRVAGEYMNLAKQRAAWAQARAMRVMRTVEDSIKAQIAGEQLLAQGALARARNIDPHLL